MKQAHNTNPGKLFRSLISSSHPLQIVGAINPYCALLAKQAGFQAIYLSGAGIANAQFGLPDLGMTSLTEVAYEVKKITNICNLPLLVDADTGWGDILNVERTVKELEYAGAAGIHLEDQIQAKRCGHLNNKRLISVDEMTLKIKVAVNSKANKDFVIMARTDAVAVEGLDAAIERMKNYISAGADMIFAEALYKLDDYKKVTDSINVPVLANITEFGKTPLFTVDELANAGVQLILYPLSAFRAMSKSALETYNAILNHKTQKSCIQSMQTREELYKTLGYYDYEKKLDQYLIEVQE